MKEKKSKKSKKTNSNADLDISLLSLLKSGAHFGHVKAKKHPAMEKYIHTMRNGIHIIDLEKTLKKLTKALSFVKQTIKAKEQIIFIGTKNQAQDIIVKSAEKASMPYVNNRWLGGTLTNFKVIHKQIEKLLDLEEKQEKGELKKYTKKEQVVFKDEIKRLNKFFGGLKSLDKLPGAVFIIDIEKEKNALAEAKKMQIPIIALVDTNVNPKEVDYPIPANDDAVKVIKMICQSISDEIIKSK
ncbi:30S ribosomal protein S2 [bacterium]|nr:30S ribosomal protein S2 [bacterium]|tara:strand:- start:6261 stop:6986 length:726 start_codon:yes stop_codon:yes gene_type:complete